VISEILNLTKRIGLLFALAALGIANAASQTSEPIAAVKGKAVRVLLVVAHPDDEYEVAGTVYRISKQLGGSVDQLIITDGEAGYRYSSLAEQYYGLALTKEAVGRAELPRIRRKEARNAAKILGIQHQWFLNEKDDHYTLNADEVLQKSWNQTRVLHAIEQHLGHGGYDFIFVLLPSSDTHGEHKAASILTLRAAEKIPEEHRPVVLAAQAGSSGMLYQSLADLPLTGTTSPAPPFQFDRDTRFGYREALSYQIVVDWVITEHKSQGLFQTRCGQDRFENFWLFSLNRRSATSEAASLFAEVTPQPKDANRDAMTDPGKPTRDAIALSGQKSGPQ
jgi:LmbE family N-acetylglucosaminyl deacetylase